MTRDYRQGIKGILSLGPTPTKPKIIKHEPDPYEDVFSPDAPVVLTPKKTSTATPRNKFGDTQAQKDKMINDYIAKPAPTADQVQNKEFWNAYNDSEKMLQYINKYGDGPKIEAPKKYLVKPSEQNKKPWRYEPWGSEVNVRPERRSQKARITTKTNKETTDG